jgi:WD repeat-containing protein 26
LTHTYRSPTPGDFAGTCCLAHFAGAGTEDQIVLGAGKSEIYLHVAARRFFFLLLLLDIDMPLVRLGGEVHLWDRETGRLLHSLRAQDQGSDVTGIAWNHAGAGQLMFASAAHDGTVRIWTAPWSGIEYSSTKPGSRVMHAQDLDRSPPVRHHPVPRDVRLSESGLAPSFVFS